MSYNVSKSSLPNRIVVKCPYEPAIIAEFHKLNGKWNSEHKIWGFDERDEPAVRKALGTVFGGSSEPTVNVRVVLDNIHGYGERRALGRTLCRRPGRDAQIKLGEGVIVLEGGFGEHGGSVKNPAVNAENGTILLVRDVPVSVYEREHSDSPETFSIHDSEPRANQVEPASPGTGPVASPAISEEKDGWKSYEIPATVRVSKNAEGKIVLEYIIDGSFYNDETVEKGEKEDEWYGFFNGPFVR